MAAGQGTVGTESQAAQPRVAFERLRERTDELELIISGISLVALVNLPGWLFERWAGAAVHLDGPFGDLVSIGFPLAIGLCYTLAGAFLVHLVARAYWVGLIGLKSVFPGGIRWEHVESFGPITRDQQRLRLRDPGTAIDAADRFASVIFAVVSLVALSILMIGLVLLGMFVIADLVVRVFGLSERGAKQVLGALAGVYFLLVLLPVLLDRGTAFRRKPGTPPSPRLARCVRAFNRVQGWLFPQSWIAPVQLVLESNLPRRVFSVMFGMLVSFTSVIGVLQTGIAREFAPIGSYDFESSGDVAEGIRSAHYENLRGEGDRLLRVPMIPADFIDAPFLRVFLPHIPDRDNALLRERCPPSADPGVRRACVAGLWAMSLDGRALDVAALAEFSERRDLGLRGLLAYVPTSGLVPGRHELVVTWNAGSTATDPSRHARRHRIPFWFAPPYQLDYVPPAAAPEAPASPPAPLQADPD